METVLKDSEMTDISRSILRTDAPLQDPCEDSVCISPLHIAMIDTLDKHNESEKQTLGEKHLFSSF